VSTHCTTECPCPSGFSSATCTNSEQCVEGVSCINNYCGDTPIPTVSPTTTSPTVSIGEPNTLLENVIEFLFQDNLVLTVAIAVLLVVLVSVLKYF